MAGGFGAFGKMSSLGDFFRVGLPQEFVEPWDTWLQQRMLGARDTLGARWNDFYLSAPIWRFSLPAGMAGSKSVSGILMASVDRVGRQYPLTLAGRTVDAQTALRHFSNTQTYVRAEDIALATLDEDATKAWLETALADLSLITPETSPNATTPYRGTIAPEHVLAAEVLTRNHGTCAIWTTAMSDDHRMMLTKSLPSAAEFTAMLDPDAAFWSASPMAQTA